jgi:hypothetical protein
VYLPPDFDFHSHFHTPHPNSTPTLESVYVFLLIHDLLIISRVCGLMVRHPLRISIATINCDNQLRQPSATTNCDNKQLRQLRCVRVRLSGRCGFESRHIQILFFHNFCGCLQKSEHCIFHTTYSLSSLPTPASPYSYSLPSISTFFSSSQKAPICRPYGLAIGRLIGISSNGPVWDCVSSFTYWRRRCGLVSRYIQYTSFCHCPFVCNRAKKVIDIRLR